MSWVLQTPGGSTQASCSDSNENILSVLWPQPVLLDPAVAPDCPGHTLLPPNYLYLALGGLWWVDSAPCQALGRGKPMSPTPWYAPAAHRPGHMEVPRLAPSPSDVPLWGLSLLILSCRPQHHVSMSVHRRGAEGEWTGREVSRGAVLGNRLPARSPSLLSRALQRELLVSQAESGGRELSVKDLHTKQIQGLFLLSTRLLCTRKTRLPPPRNEAGVRAYHHLTM